jgi:UDP-glucose 4-epimerase
LSKKYFIVGGAGFVGSHLCKKIFREDKDSVITIYDNFSSGKRWHLEEISDNKNLKIIEADVKDIELLTASMKGSDIVYHFASNPDIAKAMTQPDIDFWEGTYLTNNVVEAMRRTGVKNLLYASGSGVYGDAKYIETDEDYSPQLPISTYGASKLSCEALISSYCFMFDMNAAAFRFANVVGPNQTHGVGYDFVKKLLNDSSKLDILGDGTQSKSYIYVDDVLNAMRLIEKIS